MRIASLFFKYVIVLVLISTIIFIAKYTTRPDPFLADITRKTSAYTHSTESFQLATHNDTTRYRTTLQDQIPRIIHQSWKTSKLPHRFELWSETWKRNHPEWQYNLWTDLDNQQLVEIQFPWFLEYFNRLKTPIQKADVSRYLYLYKYGGVYADLDVESIMPIDAALNGSALAFCLMGNIDWEHSTPNSWMASKPGHSFWMYVLQYIMKNIDNNSQVEYKTGPVVIHRVLEQYTKLKDRESITLLPQDVIHPYSWRYPQNVCSAESSQFDADECKMKMVVPGRTAAITYWSHSWGGSDKAYA